MCALLLCGWMLCACELNQEYRPIHIPSVISEVRQKYQPDKRLSVFQVRWGGHGEEYDLKGEVDNPQAKEELLVELKKAFPQRRFKDEIVVLPHPDLKGAVWGVVRNSVAGQYQENRYTSTLVNQGLMGMELRLLKKWEGWYQVKMPDGYLGWMPGGYFVSGDEEWIRNWKSRPKVLVDRLFDLIRTRPAADAPSLGDVVRGCRLVRIGEKNGWVEVETPDGQRGFLESKAILDETALAAKKPTAQDLEETARTMLGFPYLWGGTSTKGVDCSGFTFSVFRFNNLVLPRDADMQSQVGQKVDIQSGIDLLKKGDLLFFGSDSADGIKITHVGLYLGEGRYIHSSGFVKINSLKEGDPDFNAERRSTLRKARRYL